MTAKRPDPQVARERLLKRKTELLRELHEMMTRSGDERAHAFARYLDAPEDEASADLITAIEVASAARDAREIEAIERALRRLGKGEYGQCIDCAEPIKPARLEASPEAERCLPCQTRYEREHGQHAPARL